MPLDNAEAYQNHIPAAVRRASERADELAHAAAEPPDENAVIEGADPVVVPEADPPVEAPAPAEDPKWEDRYRTLQGKYDAEIADFRRQAGDASQLRNDIAGMRQLIATMQAPPAASPETTTTVVIPPEDKAEYGDDLIAATQRWAMAVIQPEIERMRTEITQLRGENVQLRGGQQRVETQTAQQRMEASLSADPEIGGSWRVVNEDPGFISWLHQEDELAGQRLQLFSKAAAEGNVARVSRFFKAYIAEHTAPTQASTPGSQTPTAMQPVAGRPTLESLAAPGRATGTAGTGGAPAEKRVWTHQQITRFYDDVRRQRYAGREADMQRIEQDIIAAASEGRVR